MVTWFVWTWAQVSTEIILPIVVRVCGYGEYGEDARRMELVDVPLFSNSRDLQFLGGKVLDVFTQYENATVLVDRGGMGVAVCQQLENAGVPSLVLIATLAIITTYASDSLTNERKRYMS